MICFGFSTLFINSQIYKVEFFLAKVYYFTKKETSLGKANTLKFAWDMISGNNFFNTTTKL